MSKPTFPVSRSLALGVAAILLGAAARSEARTTIVVDPPSGPGDTAAIEALYAAASTPGARVVLNPGTYYLAGDRPIVLARRTDLAGAQDAVVRLADGTLVAATEADPAAQVAVIVGDGLSADDTAHPRAAIRALGQNRIEKIAVVDSTGDAGILIEDTATVEGCLVDRSLNRGIEVCHYNAPGADMSGRDSHVLLKDNLCRNAFGFHGFGVTVKTESQGELPPIEGAAWTVLMQGNRLTRNIVGLTTEHVVNANENALKIVSVEDSFTDNQLGIEIIGALFGANRNSTDASFHDGKIANNVGDLSRVLDGGLLVVGSLSYFDAPWGVNVGNSVRVSLTGVSFTGAGALQNGTYIPGLFDLRADLFVAGYVAYGYYPEFPSTDNHVEVLMRGDTSDDIPGGPTSIRAWNSAWDLFAPDLGAEGDTVRFIGSPTGFAAANRGLNPVDPRFFQGP